MDDVRRDCEAAYDAAAGPKVLRWYDVEHHFADFEASLDRMRWLAAKLKMPEVYEVLKRETRKLWKE